LLIISLRAFGANAKCGMRNAKWEISAVAGKPASGPEATAAIALTVPVKPQCSICGFLAEEPFPDGHLAHGCEAAVPALDRLAFFTAPGEEQEIGAPQRLPGVQEPTDFPCADFRGFRIQADLNHTLDGMAALQNKIRLGAARIFPVIHAHFSLQLPPVAGLGDQVFQQASVVRAERDSDRADKPGINGVGSVPENVTVCAGAFEAHMVLIQSVNQNPIGLDVAIPASRKFSTQGMVLECGRQGIPGDQQIQSMPEGRKILAPALHAFDIFLELRTAAE
jgi:hypothetical protein